MRPIESASYNHIMIIIKDFTISILNNNGKQTW